MKQSRLTRAPRYVVFHRRIWDRVNACYVGETYYDGRVAQAHCDQRNRLQRRNEMNHDTPPLYQRDPCDDFRTSLAAVGIRIARLAR